VWWWLWRGRTCPSRPAGTGTVVFVVMSASEFDGPFSTPCAVPASESTSDWLKVGCVDEEVDGAKMG
jgi:hypothetical protein